MQQHRGADADRVALHGGNQRTGGLAEIADEAMGLGFAGVLAAGLGAEIGKVIAGRKTVAVALEQNHPDGSILLGALEPVRQRAVHGVAQRILLVGAGERQRHDALGYFGFDMLSHDLGSPCHMC